MVSRKCPALFTLHPSWPLFMQPKSALKRLPPEQVLVGIRYLTLRYLKYIEVLYAGNFRSILVA